METSTTTTDTDPAAPRSRFARAGRSLALGLLTVLLAVAALLVGLRVARAGALPGVTVEGADVGGLADAALTDALEALGERRAASPITVTTDDGEVTSPASDLGYALDVDATRARVLRRGRQANPLAALADQLRAFGGTLPVDAVERVDDTALEGWAVGAAQLLERTPTEGTLRFAGDEVERVDPAPGARLDTAQLMGSGRAAVLAQGPDTIVAATEPIAPETSTDDVDAVFEAAQRALSDPVRLTRNGAALTFSPSDIGELLEVERAGGDLHLTIDPARLEAQVPAATVAALESDPVDARVTINAGTVNIVESVDGFRFSPSRAAAQLLSVATGRGAREVALEGEVVEPSLTTADARALEIVEVVSSFTTNHKCCQSRVTNIHRIADLVDGVLIRPGATFSVNDFVGRRTEEKGFVGGGAIFDGEFVEQVGGGVSQFATTMFNAAYFGGYAIPDYKPHSYYISRYPVGREATLNFPGVDLKVHNNSPYGIVVKTSYTDTSITVTFYGKKWVDVASVTGERRNFKAPETQYKENDALAPGAERVLQSPGQGFDITVTRTLTFPDGRSEREEFFTRYLPQPRIIERNTAAPTPSDS
jgi:vancomycin resistance protein YoaR